MNPFLQTERARKRESLLAATEADLAQDRRSLRAGPAAAARPGHDRGARHTEFLKRRKVGKHFTIAITGDQLQLRPEPGLHHRRGRPGRHLRTAHQRPAR